MNANGAAILANPHPCGHIVYPYTDENLVAQAVCLFASTGIRNGEGVILIMSKSHCEPIEHRLKAEGLDIEALQRIEQLACVVAEDLLPAFMVNGMPDEDLFKRIVLSLIQRCRASGTHLPARKVRVFGEMVCLLWNDNLPAAQRLEELWNEIIEAHSISLMCTYCLSKNPTQSLPHSLIACHSECLA
jgi:hypothetical protein